MRLLHKIIKKLKRLDESADNNFPDTGLGGLLVYALSAGALLVAIINFIYFLITN